MNENNKLIMNLWIQSLNCQTIGLGFGYFFLKKWVFISYIYIYIEYIWHALLFIYSAH